VKVDRRQWFESVVAYTVAGAVSAASVGGITGLLGRQLAREITVYIAVPIVLVLAAREWGWISFPLPESKRQTEKWWAHEFGFVIASAMWGFHIGLGFVTRVTSGGFWALVAIVLAVGDPIYGATVMLFYWFGRALSVWLTPVVFLPNHSTLEISEAILANRFVFKRFVAFGLSWSAGIALLFAFGVKAVWPLLAVAGRLR
jgi:hypothetical protein